MVGKLIKNEFINREHTLLLAFGGTFLTALVSFLFKLLSDNVDNAAIELLANFSMLIFICVIVVAAVVCFFLPVIDYRNRFFKDQAYLTHTLPVSPVSQMIARVVMDIFTVIQMYIVFPLLFVLGMGSKDIYSTIFDWVKRFLELFTGENLGEKLIVTLIIWGIAVVVQYLNNMWMLILGYTAGHSLFNQNKKVMSVVSFIAYYMAWETILSFVSIGINSSGLINLENTGNNISGLIDSLNIYVIVLSVFQLVMFVVSIILTTVICKKKLNIE